MGIMVKNKSNSYKYYSPKKESLYRLGFRLIIFWTYIYISLGQFKRLKR